MRFNEVILTNHLAMPPAPWPSPGPSCPPPLPQRGTWVGSWPSLPSFRSPSSSWDFSFAVLALGPWQSLVGPLTSQSRLFHTLPSPGHLALCRPKIHLAGLFSPWSFSPFLGECQTEKWNSEEINILRWRRTLHVQQINLAQIYRAPAVGGACSSGGNQGSISPHWAMEMIMGRRGEGHRHQQFIFKLMSVAKP